MQLLLVGLVLDIGHVGVDEGNGVVSLLRVEGRDIDLRLVDGLSGQEVRSRLKVAISHSRLLGDRSCAKIQLNVDRRREGGQDIRRDKHLGSTLLDQGQNLTLELLALHVPEHCLGHVDLAVLELPLNLGIVDLGVRLLLKELLLECCDLCVLCGRWCGYLHSG